MPWIWLLGCISLLPTALTQDAGQLAFDDFGDLREAIAFFEGVQPISYMVHLQLPLSTEDPEKRQTGPQYTTKGSVTLTFRWVSTSGSIFQAHRLLALHAKSITVKPDSIHLWQLQHLTGLQQKSLAIEKVTVDDGEEVITLRLAPEAQLQAGEIYRLELGEFHGKVEDEGSRNGVFLTSPGLATQFQLNDARRAFPCVDIPGKKAVFAFSITHPTSYAALFNTDMEMTDEGNVLEKDEGWMKTVFQSTPVMSTYTLGFTLIPK